MVVASLYAVFTMENVLTWSMDSLGRILLEDPCTLPFKGEETEGGGPFDDGSTPFGGLP